MFTQKHLQMLLREFPYDPYEEDHYKLLVQQGQQQVIQHIRFLIDKQKRDAERNRAQVSVAR